MKPTYYKLIQLKLLAPDKTIDLSGIFHELVLYEDIFSNTLSGTVILTETDNLISTTPILGLEFLLFQAEITTIIDYEKDERKTFEINFLGRVTELSPSTFVNTGGYRYMLSFVSTETIANMRERVTKSFKKATYNEMVQFAFNKLNTDSLLIQEKTRGTYDVVVPFWPPFKTINWCAARAIQTQSPISSSTSSFLFFQTLYKSTENEHNPKQHFFFQSIDSLLIKPVKKTIFLKPRVSLEKADPLRFVLAESFEIMSGFDVLENIQSGFYSGHLLEHDLIRKKYRTNKFDYKADFNTFAHTNKKEFLSDVNEMTFSPGISIYITSHENNFFRNRLLRFHQLSALSNYRAKLLIPGDAHLSVGDIIKFFMPNLAKTERTEQFDPLFSGKYLITSIGHKFDTETYKMSLEIVKESLRSGNDDE